MHFMSSAKSLQYGSVLPRREWVCCDVEEKRRGGPYGRTN